MNKLNKISGENPFKVPEGYFEKLNNSIIAETSGNGNGSRSKTMKPGFRLKTNFFLAVAASVAALILVTFTAVKLFTPDKGSGELTGLYINDYSYELIDEIDLVTLEKKAGDFILQGEIHDVPTSDIIDYLLFENVYINEIYELL